MPKTTKSGKVLQDELPSTLQRSPKEAQETFAKAHDSAVKTYGEGEQAYRVAYGALKHRFEKVGDRWVPKGHKGPSDPQSADPNARYKERGESYGGVDYYGHTKEELYKRAADLGVPGRSKMSKKDLAAAIARKQS